MIDAIRSEYNAMHIGRAAGLSLLWLVSLPFYVLGWICGLIWRAIVWCVAAIVAGFKAGAADSLRKREGGNT
jgi:hypothetical protein